MRQVFDAAYIFPMGATAKPLEPTKLRPTDDHTRTGLNAACDMNGPPSWNPTPHTGKKPHFDILLCER